jgi:hypothetical protein
LLNHAGGQKLLEMFKDPAKTVKAQRVVSNEVLRLIKGLKL